MAGIEVIRADADAVDRLTEISDQAIRRIARLGIDQWQNGYPDRAGWAEELARGRVWTARRDGRTVGACVFFAGRDPSYDVIDGAWLTGDRTGYAVMHRVCVAEEALRQGVAGTLFAFGLREAARLGCPSLRIDTHPGNLPMQAALAKAGFTPCGRITLAEGIERGKARIGYEQLCR